MQSRVVWAIVAFGLAFSLGVINHWEPLNGIETWTHWEWKWQNLGVAKMALAGLFPLLGIGLVLWQVQRKEAIERPFFWVSIAAASNFLFQVLTTVAHPQGLRLVSEIVASPAATAYYTDAAAAIQSIFEWLKNFHGARLDGHSSTHPAGPILYYALFQKLFGMDGAAFWGGMTIGLLGSLTVIVMYPFSGLWTRDPKVHLTACAIAALLPSSVVFFPEFDQIYPCFAMLLILLWVRCLNGTKLTTAALLGVVLFAASFFAYNILTVGAFMALYAGYWAWKHPDLHVVRCAVIAVGTAAAMYTILWFITGYDAPASFQHARAIQAGIQTQLRRRYRVFVFADLYDFALGAGIIAIPILLAHLTTRRKTALTLIGLVTVLIVDLSGLLRGEAARVWMFLMPLWVVPVALEIARLRAVPYYAIFATEWWITVCVKAKMSFVEP